MTLMLAVLAMAGALSAQCPGGGCGGGGGSCPSGGCPSGGAERVDKPGAKKQTAGSPASAADAPEWQNPSSDVLEKAAAEKQALLIFFPGEAEEKAGDAYLSGKEIQELSQKSAQFVKIPYNADREAAPSKGDNVVPVSKFLSDNPSREFGVKTYPTFIVADSYGNELYRISGKKPTAKELGEQFGLVSKKMDDNGKKLSKNLDMAKKAWETKDYSKSLRPLLANFKDGLVGYDAQNDSIRLYHEMLDSARSEVGTLNDGSAESVKKLKTMKTTFKGTELEKEIDAALASNSK
jgi:thioredoxin-related protein